MFTIEPMPLRQRVFAGCIVSLLAFFWTYKKRPIIPSHAHLPPTEENAGPLEQMFQDIPCEEGRGVRYSILDLDKKDVKTTCVPRPSPVEI